MAPTSPRNNLNAYEVVKPVDAKYGAVMPWFDEVVGGIQYQFFYSIEDLISRNIEKDRLSHEKKELLIKLNNERVPKCYCLDGGLPKDKFVLNNDGGKWEVYYSERGGIFDRIEFFEEDSACDYMYNRIHKKLRVR